MKWSTTVANVDPVSDWRLGSYAGRPWTGLYPPDIPSELPRFDETALSMFIDTARRAPNAPAVHYFGETLRFSDLDYQSNALAARLVSEGVQPGDRVGGYLQNDPQFVISQLAIWKAGATMVSVNPMLKAEELKYILNDSGAVALIALEELHELVAAAVVPQTTVKTVITTSPSDWAGESVDALRAVAGDRAARHLTPPGCLDLRAVIDQWDGIAPPASELDLEDAAYLVYTSGTSGRPKGVVTTHANMVYNSDVYRRWMRVEPDDVFLCGAPLFHITGLVAGIGLSHMTAMPIVLFHRFTPGLALAMAQRWRCTFTVMAITAYVAMLNHPDVGTADLTSLVKAYSGGAPVSPALSLAWEAITGTKIYNIYGLTETTSPSHACPLGSSAPVDTESGALSVGLPVPGADVRVVDPVSGSDVLIGAVGEVWIKGPMVTPGYWQQPDANETSFVDGYLRTGDLGKMDNDGWFYIVDRLKDMINVSGFKVGPREVEDYLYRHPSVQEAAVVGVPDDYRGETVKAFIVLKDGPRATEEEIIAFCRQGMAAYKYPRLVKFVDELPKTASGKILRRALRE